MHNAGPQTSPGWAPVPRPPSRRPVWIAAAVAALAVIAAAAGAGYFMVNKQDPPTYVLLSGKVVISDTDPTKAGFVWDYDPLTCGGTDDFASIVEGASLTVRDEKGAIIAAGVLGKGVPGGVTKDSEGSHATKCEFIFTVDRVPEHAFYSVQVAQQPAAVFPAGKQIVIPLGT